MSDGPLSKYISEWFKTRVRPVLEKTESTPTLEEFDKQAAQIEDLESKVGTLYPICLLGQAGVGKSTLINTLIADTEIVVPSGGGTGPLTANALRVVYGDRPAFNVWYHSKKEVDQTRFILEAEVRRQSKDLAPLLDAMGREDPQLEEIGLDSEDQKKNRTSEAIGRASLLVAGAQNARRELTYLVDSLRWVLNQEPRFRTEILDEDMERLREAQEALSHSTRETNRHFDSADDSDFKSKLRAHACGFLAPLIMEMTIQWPSPLLHSLELVDLPGIGILSDAYASVTSDYLRNRAKAVMLVADSRGLKREDAETLRNSGFLNRLLHASADLSSDPVALIVVAVKIDDVAVENWRNDKDVNGTATKSKAEHFSELVRSCREDIAKRMDEFLRDVWEDDSEGKRVVIKSILDNLQVFAVSAPQYRLHCSTDPDDEKSFLATREATNIIALRDAITQIAIRCQAEQQRRSEESNLRFFGMLRARLEVLSAQRNEERQAEEQIKQFKEALDSVIAPLQREFDTRRGGFRNFLRKTIPTLIQSKVDEASQKARKSIMSDLKKLEDAKWNTLRAAVRKEGVFDGSRQINLPHDFALRFEEPVAEVWSRQILVEIRRETKAFAEYQADAVTKVLDWARQQGIRRSTRLLEALVESVKQHRQQVNAVGKEAVDELRSKVRTELIKRIEDPIRRKCRRFVNDQKDVGTGVKSRILSLFEQLAEEVIESAAAPAVELLVTRFKEVDKEILAAFGDHSEPLTEAAEALIQRQEKRLEAEDPQVVWLAEAIETALADAPQFEAQFKGESA